jgi:gamma-glutamylcyclotransferase (GGCT)/AIG2-like uncharacterized protein YtfP
MDSNLSTNQMKIRCPNSKPLEIGYLKGYRLAFTHYSLGWNGGVADVIFDPDHEVWGLIYEISIEYLDSLDDYEGYPDAYTRFQTSNKTLTWSIPNIWVYTVVWKRALFLLQKNICY